jgi:site-specific recombinase XerD
MNHGSTRRSKPLDSRLWGIALNMVQKWLGHAQLTTTAVYADAVGEEEQSIAARMW